MNNSADSIFRINHAGILLLVLLCSGCAGLFGRAFPKNFDLRVLRPDNDPIPDAAVTVISPDTSFRAEARYDSLRGLYSVDSMPLQDFIVMIDHPEYGGISRSMARKRTGHPATVYLDTDTVAFTYILERRVPYVPRRNWMVVIADRDRRDDILGVMKDLGVEPVVFFHGIPGRGRPITIFQKDDDFDRFDSPELAAVRSLESVTAGAFFSADAGGTTYLTDEITVQFEYGTPVAKRDSLYRKYGLTQAGEHVGAWMYSVRVSPGTGEGINDIVLRLMEEEGVKLAEPLRITHGRRYRE